MADITSPFGFPYPEGTDLVRDGAADMQALAEAVNDAAANGDFGGLVAVKHAIFTGTQSASVGASANLAVTDLTITHTLADAANKLIISAYIGATTNTIQAGGVGIAVADDGTLVQIGTAAGSRTQVTAGSRTVGLDTNPLISSMPSVTFVYLPGDTNAHVYTVRAVNISGTTQTVFVNRNETDSDAGGNARATSGFVIQEVRV
jgi:hypothetical protein